VVEKLQNYSGCGENSSLGGIHCLVVDYVNVIHKHKPPTQANCPPPTHMFNRIKHQDIHKICQKGLHQEGRRLLAIEALKSVKL